MGYKCLFMNNDIYSAQDVNDAISSIISGGICNYPLGINAVSDLNSAIADIVENGVQFMGNSCRVINDNGTYKICAGTCFLNDGSQIVIDADGYEIAHENGVYEYVYFERDVLHNTINIVVSEESGGQNSVPLAEIKADGTVLDKRRFAKAKVSMTAEPQNIGMVCHISRNTRLAPGESFEYDTHFDGWKYLIYRDRTNYVCHKLEEGEYMRNMHRDNDSGNQNDWLKTTRQGSVLIFENAAVTGYTGLLDIDIELR